MAALESCRVLEKSVSAKLNNLRLGNSLRLKSQCLSSIVKNRKFFCTMAQWSRDGNPMENLPSTLKTDILERAFIKFYWSSGSELEFLSLLVHENLLYFTLPIFPNNLKGQPPACLERLLEVLVQRAPNLQQLECEVDAMDASNATAALIFDRLCKLKRLQLIKCPYITCTNRMLVSIANNLKDLRHLTVNLEGNMRVGLKALSRLPQLRHLYFCTVNASEASRRQLQFDCLQLLPKLHRADDYYAERTDHVGLLALPPADGELQLEHVALRHALSAPPTCRLANVRSLRLLEASFARPPADFLAAFANVTSLHVCDLDGHVLQQVLAALGGRLEQLTLHEQCFRSFAEVVRLCPQLQLLHCSFCSFGPFGGLSAAASLGRLRHLELLVERETFLQGVGEAVLQLLQAPQLQHLHLFGLELQAEELRPLLHLLRHGAILGRLQTLAVFKRKLNVHASLLVDNIIVHCSSIKKYHGY